MKGTYFRWTRTGPTGSRLRADILGADLNITADSSTGLVTAEIPDRPMDPDTARMVGVRLVEAAALADGDRAVRES